MRADPSQTYLTPRAVTSNSVLAEYLSNARAWHGYIRFLGLPDRRDKRNILIDSLFVEPLATRRYVSPDEHPRGWVSEAQSVFDALAEEPRLLLLGDPGSGKSTLLSYLVLLMARPGASERVARVGGWRLPVPMVLRELAIGGVRKFEHLLRAFLQHDMSAPLVADKSAHLREMLEAGRVFLCWMASTRWETRRRGRSFEMQLWRESVDMRHAAGY